VSFAVSLAVSFAVSLAVSFAVSLAVSLAVGFADGHVLVVPLSLVLCSVSGMPGVFGFKVYHGIRQRQTDGIPDKQRQIGARSDTFMTGYLFPVRRNRCILLKNTGEGADPCLMRFR